MTAPVSTVLVFFGTDNTASTVFTLDDATKGLLDGVTYLLGGDSGTDVSGYTNTASFTRGKTSPIFNEYDSATGAVQMNNETRLFDPLYAAGANYGNIKPGRKVVISTLGVTTFTGTVADWDLSYEPTLRSVAVMKLEDALALLGRQFFDAWTATASQTAGPRLTNVLNRAEVAWSGAARALDTGVSTLQADNVSAGSSVLNYCQLVAQSDLGSFFASRLGLLTFKDRHATVGATATVAFADDGTGIAFQGVGGQFGSETFYTRVIVDRAGGTAQSVSSSTAATDGIRTLAISNLLQDSDGQCLDMAQYLANIYSTGDPHISKIEVNLNYEMLTAAQMVTVLSLEINDVVSVKYTPNSVGAAISANGVIQGIDHQIVPGNHVVTLYLSKLEQANPFILDDATYGLLDGVTVLTF